MNNLQGIISRTVNNTMTEFEKLGYLTSSATNYNTNGYKAVRFENIMQETGRITGVQRTNYAVGVAANTHNPLDIALTGPGFIPVTQKDGSLAFTRDGSMKLNSEGILVTKSGDIVADGIKIPPVYNKLRIETDGTVNVQIEKYSDYQKIGQIPLMAFNNCEGLKAVEGNKLLATETSGKPIWMKDHQYIKQGAIERSNVSIFDTVQEVLKLNAGVISGTRMIKVVDDMYKEAISLRQG
ncbi:MAG: flagellar hook basal-body protein [bacterium]